jgi:predicted transcriptional regulator
VAVTSVRLSTDIIAPLEKLSQRLDRSRNYIINQAIKEYVARQSMEEVLWGDTLVALESIKSGRSISGSEVKKWLESWGDENEKNPPDS